MPRRHRPRRERRVRPTRLPPIKVEVVLPGPPTAKPVVTWQTKGRKVLITIRDFFIG